MGAARIGPPSYIRRVRQGWQARPYVNGTRVNLGVYPTETAARQMVARYLAGKADAKGLPKFVVRAKDRPGRYRWHIRQPSGEGGPHGLNVYCATTFATPELAFRSAVAFLRRVEGAFAAAALEDPK